jgi:hypothetical protein
MQMDDKDNKVDSTLADDDLNTTAPSPRPEVWKMPEPVFRQTSGKLPRGFEKNYAPSETTSAETGSENESNERVAGSEEIPTTNVEPAPKHPTTKLVLVFLGLAAMIAFIVVFLTVVYFFFWRSA